MTLIDTALEFDALDLPVQAANAYEEAIGSEQADLSAYMNLAVLYFESTDPGYAAAKKLDPEFTARASAGMYRVLRLATRRFGSYPEAAFWNIYFNWFSKYDDPNFDEARELAKKTPIAYLHLLGAPDGKRYLKQARGLLENVKKRRTVRERYIDSVVRSRIEMISGAVPDK
jgi:hypothetical protein